MEHNVTRAKILTFGTIFLLYHCVQRHMKLLVDESLFKPGNVTSKVFSLYGAENLFLQRRE